MKKFFIKNNKKGFAMLFTVLVISIILGLGLGIADTTYKQTILSRLARDSQLAFYQADSGVECGLYYDLHQGQFARGTDPKNVPQTITCGNITEVFDPTQSRVDHFVYTDQSTSTAPCFSIIFDKTDTVNGRDIVNGRGYSTCATTAQQVERALNVTY
jgi:hypothetical protein